MTGVARAQEMSETRGFMKAIVDAKTQQILGCTILGWKAGAHVDAADRDDGEASLPVIKEAISRTRRSPSR